MITGLNSRIVAVDEAGDALDFEHQCCAACQVNDKVRLVTMGSVVESILWAALARVKSPREIDMIRRATQIAALGLVEAVKATEPGVYEYHLDAAARYVFLANDARLDGYRSITAAGVGNIVNAHYFRNTSQLTSGDLVLMDYAPDFRYYTCDVGRMWPVNGTFTPEQRALLGSSWSAATRSSRASAPASARSR